MRSRSAYPPSVPPGISQWHVRNFPVAVENMSVKKSAHYFSRNAQ